MYGLTLWSVPQGFLCNRKLLLRSGSKSVRWHTQYFYCRFLHVTGKLDIIPSLTVGKKEKRYNLSKYGRCSVFCLRFIV